MPARNTRTTRDDTTRSCETTPLPLDAHQADRVYAFAMSLGGRRVPLPTGRRALGLILFGPLATAVVLSDHSAALYLGPLFVFLGLMLAGSYPGERKLARFYAADGPSRRVPCSPRLPRGPEIARRVGREIAFGLAIRPPPCVT